MAVKIAVGGEFFDRLRSSGAYYVDKTELLYELAANADNTVTLFTRPRRFGKTLTMTMMESFFDIRRDSRKIFEGLAITRHEDFCREWMNQYPVVFLTLKDVEGLTFESALNMLRSVIADTCMKYKGLESEQAVDPEDLKRFARYKTQEADREELKTSLKTILRMMNAVYGKPAILLIDEYDVPLAKASENGYYPQILDMIRGLLSTAVKTNENLMFAVITGCLKMAKESIFTGVNNFFSYSVLDNRFGEYFGFTQKEVMDLLSETGLKGNSDIFKDWYDGYIFGSTHMYCPWDVMSYVSELLYKDNSRPKNYWKNTSSNSAIRTFVENKQFNIKPQFEALMNGQTIEQKITDQLTYDILEKSEENLWSILLMTGYLTKADPEEDDDVLSLKIPNKEIHTIFQDTVVQYFTDSTDDRQIQTLMDSLWDEETTKASELLSDLLWNTISYMDYHEDYYHAFLDGIFSGRGYAVQSNKENGLGRPDILLRDDDHKRAMIIEAKKSTSKEAMPQDCQYALKQIQDRQYTKGLENYDQVICYGISFFQKTAMIKK